MKNQLAILLLVLTFSISAQTNSELFLKEIVDFQKGLNANFKDALRSPLKKENLENFNGLDFFPANESYRVLATFKRTAKEKVFFMKTTTDHLPEYLKYGELIFSLNGKQYKLNVYQNVQLIQKQGFEHYLFLPFTDLTNGSESYGGGRYIDLRIPELKTVILDFNKAYNPYCAYNDAYSCPIPPAENFIEQEIKAGVKFDNH
jgi:uncharacterized protein